MYKTIIIFMVSLTCRVFANHPTLQKIFRNKCLKHVHPDSIFVPASRQETFILLPRYSVRGDFLSWLKVASMCCQCRKCACSCQDTASLWNRSFLQKSCNLARRQLPSQTHGVLQRQVKAEVVAPAPVRLLRGAEGSTLHLLRWNAEKREQAVRHAEVGLFESKRFRLNGSPLKSQNRPSPNKKFCKKCFCSTWGGLFPKSSCFHGNPSYAPQKVQ